MNLDQFYFWATTPKRPLANFLGTYPGECVSLISQYLARVFNLKPAGWGNAVDYWTKPVPEVLEVFDKIQTNSFLPGDVLVWGDDPGTMTGPFGHLAIFYQGKIMNQNYNNQKFVTLNDFFQAGFLGVLRPKDRSKLVQKVSAEPQLSLDFHEIQPGDTFWDLEIRYNIAHGQLQQLNPQLEPTKLQIGEKIRIRQDFTIGQNDPIRYYTIKKGDTFWDLENAWQLQHGQLEQLNPGINPRTLQIGSRIRVK